MAEDWTDKLHNHTVWEDTFWTFAETLLPSRPTSSKITLFGRIIFKHFRNTVGDWTHELESYTVWEGNFGHWGKHG